MPRLIEILHMAFPRGTTGEAAGSPADGAADSQRDRLLRPPVWPPDLFGICAHLLRMTDDFTMPEFTDPRCLGYLFTDGGQDADAAGTYLATVARAADAWRSSEAPPPVVQRLWQQLLDQADAPILSNSDKLAPWVTPTAKLMAIADSASQGFGFPPRVDAPRHYYNRISNARWRIIKDYSTLYEETRIARSKSNGIGHLEQRIAELRKKRRLKQLPSSLGRFLDAHYIRVLPKSTVPDVGCNLRSLSHNLALVSDSGVTARWILPQTRSYKNEDLVLLAIPFPYWISRTCFEREDGFFPTEASEHRRHGSFRLSCSWSDGDGAVDDLIVPLATGLINEARRRFGRVDAVVFPEAAMSYKDAKTLARRLSKRFPDLQMVVTGAVTSPMEDGDRRLARNLAVNFQVADGDIVDKTRQAKSHRWKLDRSQITRYGLAEILDPACAWWESISIHDRSISFTPVREGATMTVLVCEDLARFEPVQPVLQSVGPNLVIALLMDGPQLPHRWPGRYATVLADDPGSSVLSLTSLGMIRLGTLDGEPNSRSIGLWKQPGGRAEELVLPDGTDAYALRLSLDKSYEWTLDGRSNQGVTSRFRLAEAVAVRVPDTSLREKIHC